MRGGRADVAVVLIVVLAGYSLYPAAAAVLSVPGSSAGPVAQPTDPGGGRADDPATFRFRNVSERAGFSYGYVAEYEGSKSMMSNAGVYASDYNGDGWTDLLAVGGERPALFENRGGHFVRSDALPALNRSFRAALFVDYDADGLDDLLLLPMNAEPVLLENHDGRFVERAVGLNRTLSVPTGASAADYDGNGCPDLFVSQNGNWSDAHPEGLRNYSVPEGADNGAPNLLFRGDCSGFEAATDRAGVAGHHWSLATSSVDLTGDGAPDVHVANDFGYDVLYVNRGDGTFERARLGERTNRNGMSSEVADLTGDGRPDLFVTNVHFPTVLDEAVDSTMEIRAAGNNLLVNEGNGTFDEAAAVYGVREGGWGWAAVAADFDNDGRVDLFHTTRDMNLEKYRRVLRDAEVQYLRTQFPAFDYPAAWKRTERTFVPVDAEASGFEATNGRGVARLDYDRDGRVDLAVADAGGGYALYENAGSGGSALRVDVRGTDSLPPFGARVTVGSGNATRVRPYGSGSDFLSQDSRVLHFGTGNRTHVNVTVVWADGSRRTFEARTGRTVTVAPDGPVEFTAFNRSGG